MNRKTHRFLLSLLIIFTLSFLIIPESHSAIRDVSPDILLSGGGGGVSPITGGLGLGIPLMTVPGRGGLNVPLTLGYKSGIKMEDEASWVGLGFSFGVGRIIQEVRTIPDDEYTRWNTTSPWITGALSDGTNIDYKDQDYWGISLGGGFQRMVFDNSKIFHMENFKGWKIEYFRSDLTNTKRIQYFKVTAEDGTEYIFGSSLGTGDSYNGWHNSTTTEDVMVETISGTTHTHTYCTNASGQVVRPCKRFSTIIWELTEIHGPDYVDANNNGKADDGDRGNWVRFNYYDYTNGSECYTHGGRTFAGCPYYYPPNQNWDDEGVDAQLNWTTIPSSLTTANHSNWIPTQQTVVTITGITTTNTYFMTRRTEADFVLLKEIETPTHLATVVVGDRDDYRSNWMVSSRAKKIDRSNRVKEEGERKDNRHSEVWIRCKLSVVQPFSKYISVECVKRKEREADINIDNEVWG